MTNVHVNVPYSMLLQRINLVIEHHIYPEIYFSAEDLDACRQEEAKQLSEVLHRSGLQNSIHGPFMDLSPGGIDRRVKEVTLDRFCKTFEMAVLFKPKAIVFHPGYEKWKFNGNVNLWLESSLQTWKPLAEEAKKHGLIIAVENVFEENPDTLLSLLNKIDSSHFRFCFDTGHHHIFSNTPLSLWIETLKDYLVEVHLHDNHREMDEHLPMGEGSFNFNEFFNLLSHYQLNPILTLEPHEEAHLRRGLEAIKKYISPNPVETL